MDDSRIILNLVSLRARTQVELIGGVAPTLSVHIVYVSWLIPSYMPENTLFGIRAILKGWDSGKRCKNGQ